MRYTGLFIIIVNASKSRHVIQIRGATPSKLHEIVFNNIFSFPESFVEIDAPIKDFLKLESNQLFREKKCPQLYITFAFSCLFFSSYCSKKALTVAAPIEGWRSIKF